MFAPQPLERRHHLVADEAVALVERRDEDVDRFLRRDLRERAGNMPAHPDVLFGIPEEEGQRVDDRLAVADERRAGAALEPAVSQERDERGDENEVVDALDLRRMNTFHRLVRDFWRRIVQERNQQTTEPRVGDLTDGDRDISARGSGRVTGVAREIEQRRFGLVDILRARARRHGHGRRRPDARIGIGEERARERRGIFMADRRQRPNRGGADARVAVAEHAADVRDPLLRDVAAHVAKRRQRAPADFRRLVVEQQRRHEIALVERLEDVDGVDDPRRIGVRQLLHERFDRRELRSAQPQFLRLDHAGGDAAPERGQVFALARRTPRNTTRWPARG